MEKRLLQSVIAVAAVVPRLAGLAGVLHGPGMAGAVFGGAADSQFRYLSGLLIGVGGAYWIEWIVTEHCFIYLPLLAAPMLW